MAGDCRNEGFEQGRTCTARPDCVGTSEESFEQVANTGNCHRKHTSQAHPPFNWSRVSQGAISRNCTWSISLVEAEPEGIQLTNFLACLEQISLTCKSQKGTLRSIKKPAMLRDESMRLLTRAGALKPLKQLQNPCCLFSPAGVD